MRTATTHVGLGSSRENMTCRCTPPRRCGQIGVMWPSRNGDHCERVAKHHLNGLRFQPVTIPHDASQTVAFRIETTHGTIGFATDIGAMTPELVERFRDCQVLVVESNHATELLRVSPYSRSTRERIAGTTGHLSNESLADFIRSDLGRAVRCLVLVHLSRVNNVPEIAEMTLSRSLGRVRPRGRGGHSGPAGQRRTNC